MRITACIVVAVLGSSPDALAQPPAHAKGKAQELHGHAKRNFAVDDFRIGLASAPKDADKRQPAAVQSDLPRGPQLALSRSPPPDCLSR